ncbi:DUF4193 domain-containing protein [Catellatospora sp. NPDC049609]|uniref:DUF4193 domain-containing protein n=1 Tax=Catellatospora sp. NPDC049609 TaxID=3155505 RepID=UPI00343B2F91
MSRSSAVDYDAPRRPAVAPEDDSLEELQARRSVKAPTVDDGEDSEGFELPDLGPVEEELTVAVIPMQADEFRCGRCFLVHHRSQLAGHGPRGDICRECS